MTEPNLKKKVGKGTEGSDVAGTDKRQQGGQVHLEKSRPKTPSGADTEKKRGGTDKELELAGRGVRANPDARRGQQSPKREMDEAEDPEPMSQDGATDPLDVASPIDERATRKRGDKVEENT